MTFDFDKSLCNQARNGCYDSARGIMEHFALHGAKNSGEFSNTLLAYLAECMKAWLKTDLDPRAAAGAFHVARPQNRPSISSKDGEQRVKALIAYFLALGNGETKIKARELAGRSISKSPENVRDWVRAQDAEYIAAWMSLTKVERQRATKPPAKKYASRTHTAGRK